MRAAIYIRVSTEEQKINGLSVEAQKDNLTDYASKNNLEIIDYYIDAGLTARKRLSHRKDLLRLLDDVKKGLIDIIIFTKLDRWFRNIADYYKVQEVLDNHKVNWKTIYEDYDTSTANGRLHINIMLSIAQDEADRTSERIKVVFENKRSRGETPAWKAPLGYKVVNSKLIINEDTKDIAIDIFDYYDTHHSVMGCTRMAYEKHNYKIYDYSIRRMFENKTYIGEVRGYKNFCEPIIDPELFYRIHKYREVREFKNQLTAGRVYLFSSLIVCKECRRNMTCVYTRQKQKNGIKEFRYYRCKESKYTESCPHIKRASEEYIEAYLLGKLKSKMMSFIVAQENRRVNTNTKKIDILKIKKRLEKLKDLYLDDLIDKEAYKLEYESLTVQLELANEIKPVAVDKYRKYVEHDLFTLYNSFSPSEKKTFWLNIIDKIVIDKDNNIEFFLRK